MSTIFTRRIASFAALALGGTVSLAACNLDVPDLNAPGLDELENNPTKAGITAACTGLLIGNRGNTAAENGLVTQLGILGREAYNFDTADPRYISEMLAGALNKSSPFGGNFWGGPYANIRLGHIILHGVDKVPEFTPAERSAIKGFTHTIQAHELLKVIITHDTNGAVIDTDRDPLGPLAPIVDKAATYTEIAKLLDMGSTELTGGSDAFPFLLSNGFDGFDTPATFAKLNRAIRARVAIYVKDYPTALTALGASFLDDTSPNLDLDDGVYYAYSTKTGDTTNILINVNIYAHPTLATDAMKNGVAVDLRFTRKVATAKNPGASGDGALGSTFQFTKLYSGPDSPVAMIRNEELILIKAEALFYTGMVAQAVAELNIVRTTSGGLLAIPPAPLPNETTFIDELLYERRYSLLFEGGHRWIDLRRFNRPLPLDVPSHQRNVRYPIPLAECDARPGEMACSLGST
jgi:hypothetical protein